MINMKYFLFMAFAICVISNMAFVSCKDDDESNDSRYTSYLSCPDNNHPHIIDLGLTSGTKWACCNVGASTPGEFGDYYACGETETKATYDWDSYTHSKNDKDAFNKKKDFSGTEYDVAHVRWGGKFRMANASKCRELWEQCSHEMVTQEGVYGIRFTGDNGGSIFIPAAGYILGEILYNVGTSGFSWTSSIFSDASNMGMTLDYCNKMPVTGIDNDRCVGHTIRPVIH